MSTPALLVGVFLVGLVFGQQLDDADLPCLCPDNLRTTPNSYCVCVESFICDKGVIDPTKVLDEKIDVSGGGKCYTPDPNLNSTCSDAAERCCKVPEDQKPKFCESRRCGQHVPNNKLDDRILAKSGVDVSKGEYPWQVAILLRDGNSYSYKCWGSLIHPQVVLTATHCLKTFTPGPVPPQDIKIRTVILSGEVIETPAEINIDRHGKEVIFHSPYYPKNLANDTALIILDEPFPETTDIGTICLPPKDFQIKEGSICRVLGWDSEPRIQDRYPLIVTLPLIDHDRCETLLKKTALGADFMLHSSFLCAGGQAGEDSCVGDGGSPLICNYDKNPFQLGIVSWGLKTCAQKDVPGVYVNLPLFVDWIRDTLKNKGINID